MIPNQLRRYALAVSDRFFRYVEYACRTLLAIEVAIISYVVIHRYAFGGSPRGGEEFALLCMVWFSLLSAALAMRDNLHIRLSVLDRLYPATVRKALAFANNVLSLVFGVIFLVHGLALVEATAKAVLPASGWPRPVLLYSVPVTGALFVIVFLEKVLRGDIWTLIRSQ